MTGNECSRSFFYIGLFLLDNRGTTSFSGTHARLADIQNILGPHGDRRSAGFHLCPRGIGLHLGVWRVAPHQLCPLRNFYDWHICLAHYSNKCVGASHVGSRRLPVSHRVSTCSHFVGLFTRFHGSLGRRCSCTRACGIPSSAWLWRSIWRNSAGICYCICCGACLLRYAKVKSYFRNYWYRSHCMDVSQYFPPWTSGSAFSFSYFGNWCVNSNYRSRCHLGSTRPRAVSNPTCSREENTFSIVRNRHSY